MKGSDTNIHDFMVEKRHYIVPIYQRDYSWGQAQCATIYEDLYGLKNSNRSHFVGSVVYAKGSAQNPGIYLIDGQQRVITMYLFYLALSRAAQQPNVGDTTLSQLIQSTLLNSLKGKHRFTLSSKEDQVAMDKLFAGNEDEYIRDSHLTQNYYYFYNRLTAENQLSLVDIFDLTIRLSMVKIELDDEEDDAQVIFESLNSKGLTLSHGEKVKNFVLMGIDPEQAQESYATQWYPMELNCKHAQGDWGLDNFIYYFLAIERNELPEFGNLYAEFKSFHHASDKVALMETMNKYSELFRRIKTCSYELYPTWDTNLSEAERQSMQAAIVLQLKRLSYFPYERHIPFVMQTMWLHLQHRITAAELLETLKLIESFYFRRWACGVPTNTLSRFFATLHAEIGYVNDTDAGDFISKLKFVLRTDRARLPSDTWFKQCIENNEFYYSNTKLLNYTFDRLENFEQREQVHIMDDLDKNNKAYTIEHVMPQTLTKEWRTELGPNAEELHELWKDRLANLTLTAHNSSLGNRPFAEKRDMPKGYKDSILRLTKSIAAHEHWNEEDLKQRATELSDKALKIWPYPA